MWELQNKQKFTTIRGCLEKRCPICGKYFLPKELYYLVICNAIPEAREKKLENLMTHVDCWDSFCEGITDNEVLASKIAKHRTPKAQPYTEKQMEYVKAFGEAAKLNGFSDVVNGRNCVRAKCHGSSMTLTYNVRSNTIAYSDRRKKTGLFDRLFTHQITTNVFNKMHEILGDDVHDDYSVSTVVAQAVNETNKLFGNS